MGSRSKPTFHVITNRNAPAGIRYACWTALDSEGRRGPVYEDLDDEAIGRLRGQGYVVEPVTESQIDKSGKY